MNLETENEISAHPSEEIESDSSSEDEEINRAVDDVLQGLLRKKAHDDLTAFMEAERIDRLEDEKEFQLAKEFFHGDSIMAPDYESPRIVAHIQSRMNDKTVLALSNPSSPCIDLDSIVFWESQAVFGKVIDVFGPVETPWYLIVITEQTNELLGKMDNLGVAVLAYERLAPTLFPEQLIEKDVVEDEDDEFFSDDEKEQVYESTVKRPPKNKWKQSKEKRQKPIVIQGDMEYVKGYSSAPSYPHPPDPRRWVNR